MVAQQNQQPPQPQEYNDDWFVQPEKILVSWTAYSRPFKRFRKEFYINVGSVAVLFGLILFIIDGLMPAVLVAALYFIFYVFTTIEPQKIEYQITTYGVKFATHRIEWPFLGRYKLAKRFNNEVLVIETADAPWKVEMVIDSTKKAEIESVISKYLYLNDSPPTQMDKATDWISSKIKM